MVGVASALAWCGGLQAAEPDPTSVRGDLLVSPASTNRPLAGVSWGRSAGPWEAFNAGLSNQLGGIRGANPAATLESYERAAAENVVPALLNLGYLQETGVGVPRNASLAVRYYERAAALGSLAAHYNLGRLHLLGSGGVTLDLVKARRHLTEAAEGGILPAQLLLAQVALDADQAPQAFAWALKAANQGYVPAMHLVGHLYLHGQGVGSDPAKALLWLQRSAARDFTPAHHSLGILYDTVREFRDPSMALAQFRKAADRGHRESQYQLGYCYYSGRGTAIDLAEALRWWTLSEVAGLDAASHARAQLLPRIAPADLVRGERLVAEFRPVASAYVEPDLVEASMAAEASRASALDAASRGTGFFLSDSGHVLLGSRVSESPGGRPELFIPGGQLRLQVVRRHPGLGLTLAQPTSLARAFRPLQLQTNRAGLVAGRTVFVAAMSPIRDGRATLEARLTRTRIASASGPRANPRQITLEGRFGPEYAGCPVLDAEGLVLAVVVEPGPDDPAIPGTCAVTAKQVLEFVRSAGLELQPTSQLPPARDPDDVEPAEARGSLAFIATRPPPTP